MYLRTSWPCPTLSFNFWRFGGTSRFAGFLDIISYFFIRCVVFFDNKSMINQCVPFQKLHHSHEVYFKVIKHSSGTFGLCESNFNLFNLSTWSSFFYVVYFIFFKCGSVTSILVNRLWWHYRLLWKIWNCYTEEQMIPRLYLYNLA